MHAYMHTTCVVPFALLSLVSGLCCNAGRQARESLESSRSKLVEEEAQATEAKRARAEAEGELTRIKSQVSGGLSGEPDPAPWLRPMGGRGHGSVLWVAEVGLGAVCLVWCTPWAGDFLKRLRVKIQLCSEARFSEPGSCSSSVFNCFLCVI